MKVSKNKPIVFMIFAAVALVGLAFIASEMQNQPNVGIALGNVAPELEFADPKGKKIKLSSLRGNIVLIEFWASWCGPCRTEKPKLAKLYQNYNKAKFANAKGFEIYSVSLDQDRDKWIKAIQDDGLIWNAHVSDLKFWKSEGARIFRVNAIPHNVLIDQNGVILEKNISLERLEGILRSKMRN